MAAPSRWMEWLSTYRGTATAGPNFAWVLAARALRQADGPLDLSPLRVALNGAEPVDPEAVEAFVAAGARHGLRPGAVFPAFGMAEVAIAGTFPVPMAGLRTDDVDGRVLETERYAAPSDPDGRPAPAGWPASAGRCPVWRCASSTPNRATARAGARGRRAARSGAPRSRPATTSHPDATAAAFHGELAAHRRPRRTWSTASS